MWQSPEWGAILKTGHEKVLKTAEAESWFDLDWFETYLIEDRRDCGWLSREGYWYGCQELLMTAVAHRVFGKSCDDLLDSGWVQVRESRVIKRKPLTYYQKWYCKNYNIVVDNEVEI